LSRYDFQGTCVLLPTCTVRSTHRLGVLQQQRQVVVHVAAQPSGVRHRPGLTRQSLHVRRHGGELAQDAHLGRVNWVGLTHTWGRVNIHLGRRVNPPWRRRSPPAPPPAARSPPASPPAAARRPAETQRRVRRTEEAWRRRGKQRKGAGTAALSPDHCVRRQTSEQGGCLEESPRTAVVRGGNTNRDTQYLCRIRA
jgi:hypothetical protein